MNDEFDEIESGESEDSENEKTEKAETEKEEKSISSDLIRGHINTILLRSLSDSDKYGYEIISEIEKKSCGQYSLKQPSLYSALKRLEKQGFVTSYWGGTAGGGRRKYFSLTEDGKTIADQNRSEWEYSRTIIDSLISDKDFDFSNPVPSAVNMRVLKEATTRVPSRETRGSDDNYEEEERRVKELETRYNELLAEHERVREELTESREREEYYRSERFTSSESELDDDERARYQSIIRGRDEIINNLDARYEELLEKEKLDVDVIAVISSQEEVGERGITAAMHRIKADAAICFEGCPADDTSAPAYMIQDKLHGGVMLRYMDATVICTPGFNSFANKIAEKCGIKIQMAVRSGGGNNGAYIVSSNGGTPVIVAGIPVRYIHTFNCIAAKDDFDSTVALGVELCKNLDGETIKNF